MAMATGLVFAELYEPLRPAELEEARGRRHGRVFPFRHRQSGQECAVRFLSVDKLVQAWMGAGRTATSTAPKGEPKRYTCDIMTRAVTVLDGLRHPNLLGLADPVLYMDEDDHDDESEGTQQDLKGAGRVGGLLKVVTECGDRLVTEEQEEAEEEKEEVVDGGRGTSQGVDMEEAKELFLHLARGLHCLHANLYLHRGIQLASVARCKKRGGALQLSSFCSTSSNASPVQDVRVAPEVRSGAQPWSAAADVWALGMCFYEYLTGGELPSPHTDTSMSEPQTRHSVFASELGAWDLISSMLRPDPAHRPTITQVMNHSWLTQQGLHKILPLDYQQVRLSMGREVSVMRLDRGKSVPPLGLSVMAVENLDDLLRDPDVALFVPSHTLAKQFEIKDGVRTWLGAMLRQMGCAAPEEVQHVPPATAPTSASIPSTPRVGPASAPSDPQPPAAAEPARCCRGPMAPPPCPTTHNAHTTTSHGIRRVDLSAPPNSWPTGPFGSLWAVPEATDPGADDEAIWALQRGLVSAVSEAASASTQEDTVVVLPLSLFTARCRNTGLQFIAQELCSLCLLLLASSSSSPRPGGLIKKVVVTTKDVGELRDLLSAFHSLDGLCLSDVPADLLALSHEVASLFQQQAGDLRADLHLRAYFDNLHLLLSLLLLKNTTQDDEQQQHEEDDAQQQEQHVVANNNSSRHNNGDNANNSRNQQLQQINNAENNNNNNHEDEGSQVSMLRRRGTATCLQVCLWCGLIGRRLSELVVERGFQVTEVLSGGSSSRTCIAVLNHEKVDHLFDSLHWNLDKASRSLGTVTLYDALQSLRSLRGLLGVLLLPRVSVLGMPQGRRSNGQEGGAGGQQPHPEDEDEEEECLSVDTAGLDECCSLDRTVVERFCGGVCYDASRSSPTTWGHDESTMTSSSSVGDEEGEEDAGLLTDDDDRASRGGGGEEEEEEESKTQSLEPSEEGEAWSHDHQAAQLQLLWREWRVGGDEADEDDVVTVEAGRPRSWSEGFDYYYRLRQQGHTMLHRHPGAGEEEGPTPPVPPLQQQPPHPATVAFL